MGLGRCEAREVLAAAAICAFFVVGAFLIRSQKAAMAL